MVFITYSSLSSFEDTDTSRFGIPHLDKAVHFTFYCVAVILAVFFIRELTKGKYRLKKALLFSVIGAIIFGLIIEGLQYSLTVDRHADIFDALANSFGAIVGAVLIKFFFSKERQLKWKN